MPTLSRQQKVDLLMFHPPVLVKYKDHVVGLVPTRNLSSYQAGRFVRADGCKILAENLVHLDLHEDNSVIIHIDDIVEIYSIGEWYDSILQPRDRITFQNGSTIYRQGDGVEFVPTDQAPATLTAEVDVIKPWDDWGRLPAVMTRDITRALNDAVQEHLTNAGNGLLYTND